MTTPGVPPEEDAAAGGDGRRIGPAGMAGGSGLSGPFFLVAVVGGVAVASWLDLLVLGRGPEGLRSVLRTTGRVSTLLFAGAFASSGLYALWPGVATRWLRRNRRAVGLAFAGSQAIHLAALVSLVAGWAEFRQRLDPTTLVVGGMGFVFTFVMAATSFDGAVRWLGRRWRTLHLIGGWWIFAVLLATILPDVGRGPASAALAVVLLATLFVRVRVARLRRVGSAAR